MTTESRPTRFPVGVVIAAAIALTFMIIWSAVHWSQMAPTIVTREAGGNHGASIISRGFNAAAMPAWWLPCAPRRARSCTPGILRWINS